MTQEDALKIIGRSVSIVLEGEVPIQPGQDLVNDGILDSLEYVRFTQQLEKETGGAVDADALAEDEISQVDVLIRKLSDA